jgi:hypothetical protein
VTYDLEAWNRYWRLSGDKVVCRKCLSTQFADARADAFEHLPSCPRARDSLAPWDELDAALQSINAAW